MHSLFFLNHDLSFESDFFYNLMHTSIPLYCLDITENPESTYFPFSKMKQERSIFLDTKVRINSETKSGPNENGPN